ncbi:unnamed protein product, partial [Symbiodinium necroappetens]
MSTPDLPTLTTLASDSSWDLPGQPLEQPGTETPAGPKTPPSAGHEDGGADPTAAASPKDLLDEPGPTALAGILPEKLSAEVEKAMKEVEESSLSLSGLIPPMGHPPSLREAGAFVGAARKASLKQPLKFDNVQGFIVDCMKQTARGEPSSPSSSRADKEEDLPEKPGSAEEELARLK